MTKDRTGMTESGFCAHPSQGSHEFCREFVKRPCTCVCHTGGASKEASADTGGNMVGSKSEVEDER